MSAKGVNFWVIADTHFGHHRIKEFEGRPDDHEERTLAGLGRLLRPGDVLIHLGDVALYDTPYWTLRLVLASVGCVRWLTRGNHDRDSLTKLLGTGWHVVADRIDLHAYGRRIAFSHRPLPDSDDYDINIHGHHHLSGHHPEDTVTDKHRLVYMEHHYTPIKLQTLVGGVL